MLIVQSTTVTSNCIAVNGNGRGHYDLCVLYDTRASVYIVYGILLLPVMTSHGISSINQGTIVSGLWLGKGLLCDRKVRSARINSAV